MRFDIFRAVVQLVEHRSPKPAVAGSSPARPVIRAEGSKPQRGLGLTAIPLEDGVSCRSAARYGDFVVY